MTEAYESAKAISKLDVDSENKWKNIIVQDEFILPKNTLTTNIFLKDGKNCYWLDDCEQDVTVCEYADQEHVCYLTYDTPSMDEVFVTPPLPGGPVMKQKVTRISPKACYQNCKNVSIKFLGITIGHKEDCSVKNRLVTNFKYVITPTEMPSARIVKTYDAVERQPYIYTSEELDKIQLACSEIPADDESGNWIYFSDRDRIWVRDVYSYDFYDFVSNRMSTSFKPTEELKSSEIFNSFVYDRLLIANPETDLSSFSFKHVDTKDGVIQKEVVWDALGLSCDLNSVKNPDSGYKVGIQFFGIKNAFSWSTFAGAFVLFLVFNFVGYIAKHS
jgi:hypothetical protein